MSSEREAELLRIIAGLKTEAAFNFQQYQDLGAATHQADLLSEARFDRLCKDMDRMTDQRDALRAELAQAKPKRASTLDGRPADAQRVMDTHPAARRSSLPLPVPDAAYLRI